VWTPNPEKLIVDRSRRSTERCSTLRDAVSFNVVIPARWGATRFPGKVLAQLAGRSVLARVHDAAVASGADQVIVATDDVRVQAHALDHGFDVHLTSETHTSGTERIAEVARVRGFGPDVALVNLQGDAPLMDPTTVRLVGFRVWTPAHDVHTASVPLAPGDAEDPNVVKVQSLEGRARAFARHPLPAARRHLGIYGFRVRALLRWVDAAPVAAELSDRLEQQRPMALGMPIRVWEVPPINGPDVDTPEDLAAAEEWLATPPFTTHQRERLLADTLAPALILGAAL
jgi:3-deoxy-manno-octulosonate cytidylyltransferase (CMP-KDO synthetase)